jgi:hypothetical protein
MTRKLIEPKNGLKIYITYDGNEFHLLEDSKAANSYKKYLVKARKLRDLLTEYLVKSFKIYDELEADFEKEYFTLVIRPSAMYERVLLSFHFIPEGKYKKMLRNSVNLFYRVYPEFITWLQNHIEENELPND